MRRTVGTGPVLASVALIAAATVLAPPGSASQGGRPLAADLTGAAEVPGPADPDGSGTAVVKVNVGLRQICYTLTVADIDPAAAAHIHAAPAGMNGPVVVPLVPPTSGSSSGCASVDRALAKAILKTPDSYYVNVHNAEFPAGAVRGQLAK